MKDDARVAIDRAGKLVAELGKLSYLINKEVSIKEIDEQFNSVLSHAGFVTTALSTINREIGQRRDILNDGAAEFKNGVCPSCNHYHEPGQNCHTQQGFYMCSCSYPAMPV